MFRGFAEEFLHSGALLSLDQKRVAIGWGEQHWSLKPSEEISFYFPDFFLKTVKPWLLFEKVQIVTIEELLSLLPKASPIPSLTWQRADKDLFERHCSNVLSLIDAQVLHKAVPYSYESCPEPFTAERRHISLLSCLAKAVSSPLALYGFWNKEEGMLGATPELLFRQLEGRTEACAVAGTFAKGQKEWQNDGKIREEHEIVVKGIKESLSLFGEVAREKTEAIPFSHLYHLQTSLKLSANPSFLSLVKALHPTPALGAYPRDNGEIWLNEMQKFLDRRRYGAPVGLQKMGERGHCWVAIRNIQWTHRGEAAVLIAGCGIVRDSDPATEWEELQTKFKATKAVLAI